MRRLARALEQAEPQAIVINSGVANAATGEPGRPRRDRDRRRGGAAALPARRAGARALDRRDRRAAADGEGRRAASSAAAARALGRTAAPRGRGDHDDRHEAEDGGRLTRRLHGRRDGQGRRDDPPAARDDARRHHDRLPARARRGEGFLAARGRRELQPRSRSTASARRTTRSSCSRTAAAKVERTPASDVAFAAALARGLRRPRAADRRRRRGRDDAARDRGRRRRERRARRGRSRGRDRDLAARQDRAFGRDANWGRVLAAAGSAPYNGGFAALDPKLSLALQRRRRCFVGRARRRRAGLSRAPSARSSWSSASARAAPRTSASDLTYDYVRINADYRT